MKTITLTVEHDGCMGIQAISFANGLDEKQLKEALMRLERKHQMECCKCNGHLHFPIISCTHCNCKCK